MVATTFLVRQCSGDPRGRQVELSYSSILGSSRVLRSLDSSGLNNQSETWVGCIVFWTTATTCSLNRTTMPPHLCAGRNGAFLVRGRVDEGISSMTAS